MLRQSLRRRHLGLSMDSLFRESAQEALMVLHCFQSIMKELFLRSSLIPEGIVYLSVMVFAHVKSANQCTCKYD